MTHIRSLLTFSLAIVYLGNLFIQSDWINHVTLVFMMMVIALSLPVVTGSSKVIAYISFTVSIIILFYFQAPLKVWEEAIEENLYLVVLFTLVPLLRIPIQHGGYFEALQAVFRRFVNTRRRFYLLVSLLSAFVGVLVNLAVVPLVHAISRASEFSGNKKLLSSAISRGFTTCTIWSPTMASIGLILSLTGAQWHVFFPFGLFSGLICGLIGYAMTMIENREPGEVILADINKSEGEVGYGKAVELSAFGIILITSIAAISLLADIQAIIVVSMAALIFPIIWLTLIKRLPVLFREFKGEYYHTVLPGLKNEIILFIGAGLFTTSITYSRLGDYVPRWLSLLVGDNIFFLTLVVVVIGLLISAIGVHPIVTVAVIGGTVKASAYGVSPTYMAMVLAIVWAIGISISPSAANIIAVAGLAESSPIEVGLRWNGKYAFISAVVLILLVTLFRTAQLL